MNSEEMRVLDEIYEDVFGQTDLLKLIDGLVSASQGAKHHEVKFYLQSIHYAALRSITQAHVKYKLSEEDNRFPSIENSPRQLSEIPSLIDRLQNEKNSVPPRIVGELFSVCGRIAEAFNLIRKYQFRTDGAKTSNIMQPNRELIILDFPWLFVEQLSRLLQNNWYVACFMKDYHNSSVWGHYGDNHRGACLIFSPEERNGIRTLPMRKITGWSAGPNQSTKQIDRKYHWQTVQMRFHDVRYQERIEQIDFFQNIGVLPKPVLLRNWYADAAGNRSRCGSHIGSKEEELWREEYWNKFYRDITAKTRDWEYERECRLILQSSLLDLRDQNRRVLTYSFSSLKGIIFGINMTQGNKFTIIDIIRQKCAKKKRHNFDFYQAYYSHNTGMIERHKIDISFDHS